LKAKNGGVSIEKVKEMLKKGTILRELTNLLLNKNKKKVDLSILLLTQVQITLLLSRMKKKRL
jgi:hypothetical protein